MAATAAGRQLTEQHRLGQLRIRAQALQNYTQLWPIWEGDEDSFLKLVLATVVLVRTYRGLSSTYAGSYFQSYRMAEGAPGDASSILADPIDEAAVRAGMYVTGQTAVRDALKAGRPREEAKSAAFTRTSGSLSRHVLDGGRETILRSVQGDKAAVGWGRVTDGDPCAFCAMLAGRGPVYKSDTAGFQAHDHDACTAEPVYTWDAPWPGRAREFHDLYNESTLQATEDGDLRRGTSNDLFNAFRRAYEAQRHQPSRST